MEHCGLDPDLIVDEDSAPYPFGQGFGVSELTTEGYSRLMRIERGRVRRREIFGPLRLHYGYFKLMSHHSKYLVARDGPHIVGAVGFTLERLDRMVRVFELISLRDDVIRFLLDELGRRCREEWEIDYVEIDVSAHAPRMQRTLLQLGFVPVAYVPALAFADVERLDLVKFARLHVPADVSGVRLIPPISDLARLVMAGFERREVMPRLGEAVDRAGVFQGLEEEQRERLAAEFGFASFEAGTEIFREGEPSGEMFVVLSGEVVVRIAGEGAGAVDEVGRVGPGECLGEIAVLTGEPHSATAVACGPVEAVVLTREKLLSLVRLRPGIGVVVYRNLARGLGEKLRRADRRALGGADLP
jgi:hypothetical protein